MDIEKLKQKIAEVVGVKSAESDLAYHLCVEKISELLDYDEALKIPGLGIFNLKREPLTRQERKNSSSDETQSRQSLIFSPEKDSSSTESDPMFITINLDEGSSNLSEFDENIFSLGVDKPLVPVSSTKIDFDSDISENLDEKISVLVSQSERIPNFDMWEDYSVVNPEDTPKEEYPFSLLDDELKDIMAQTDIGDENNPPKEEQQEELKEEEIEETNLADELEINTDLEEINLADELNIEDDIEQEEPADKSVKEEPSTDEDQEDDSFSALDDAFKEFDDLNLAGDAEEESDEKNGIEDITFSDDLDLDSLVGPEEDIKEEAPEESKSEAEKPKEDNADDEEINWNWGDELKEELEGKDDESEVDAEGDNQEASIDNIDLEAELAVDSEEDEESNENEVVDIEDELDLSFDEELNPSEEETPEEVEEEKTEEEKSEEGETEPGEEEDSEEDDIDELDLNIEDDQEENKLTGNNTVEYTPGSDEAEKPGKKSSKKFMSGIPLYGALAAFVLIGSLGIYFLFFSGSSPVEELPEGSDHEAVNEDTISTQLNTKLEPNDNPVVKTEIESDNSETENLPEQENPQLVDDNSEDHTLEAVHTDTKEEDKPKEYTTAPNSLPEKHNVKEKPKEPVISTSNLYRKFPNEKRLSNLVFFDGKSYNVQVSSWKTNQQAEAHARSLIKKGHNAFIVEAYLSSLGGTWYRVRIGDFKTAKEAEDYRKENKL